MTSTAIIKSVNPVIRVHLLLWILALGSLCNLGSAANAQVGDRGADINHLHISGQSLATGYATTDYVPLSTSQPYANQMFSGGLFGYDFSSFAPLRQYYVETPASNMANTISHLIETEMPGVTAQDHPMLMTLSARGGVSLLDLDWYGGDPYGIFWRGMYSVWAARQVALSNNRSYKVQGVAWVQGESDIQLETSAWVYMTRLLKLQWDYNAYFRMFAGQWDRVPLFTYQTSSHQVFNKPGTIAQAQLLASEWSPDVYLVTPIYHLPYSDQLHLTNKGYQWMGAYFGKVYKRVIIDGQNWKPLSPVDIYATDNRTVIAQFHVPVPPLVLDTEAVSDPSNYGFEVRDGLGAVPLTSVTAQGTDEVHFTTQRPMQGAVTLSYAYRGQAWSISGPQSGARGNLRDSDPAMGYNGMAVGEEYPLHNWCVIFEKPVDVLY